MTHEPFAFDWPDGDQPKAGDVLLACRHQKADAGGHVFAMPEGLPFILGGLSGVAQWLVMCPKCFVIYKDDPLGCPMEAAFEMEQSS